MTIPEQNKEIQRLLKRIADKSKNFAALYKDTYYGDLGWVLDELKHVEGFLNDKYLSESKMDSQVGIAAVRKAKKS